MNHRCAAVEPGLTKEMYPLNLRKGVTKMKPVVLLLGLLALVLGLAAAALAQTYTIIDVPDAGGTWPVSINNGGDVAGLRWYPERAIHYERKH